MQNQAINSNFTDSKQPQCLYQGDQDIYILNEAAYHQIQSVTDMLAAISAFSENPDKRTEQLFNTLHFAAELLDESTSWNLA